MGVSEGIWKNRNWLTKLGHHLARTRQSQFLLALYCSAASEWPARSPFEGCMKCAGPYEATQWSVPHGSMLLPVWQSNRQHREM